MSRAIARSRNDYSVTSFPGLEELDLAIARSRNDYSATTFPGLDELEESTGLNVFANTPAEWIAALDLLIAETTDE